MTDKIEAKKVYDECKKNFIKTIEQMSGRYAPSVIFNDFIALSTYSLSNVMDYKQSREVEYKKIISKYSKEEADKFPQLLAYVTEGLTVRFGDFLGECFENMDFHSASAGQFFTPYHVSKLLADITIQTKEELEQKIKEQGYIGLNDCACGAGCTLIAGLERVKDLGINFQTQSLTIGQDIDQRCAMMAYIQLSLIGAPAIIIIGDTLKMEIADVFYTPFYKLNSWRFKKPTKEKIVETVARAQLIQNNSVEPKKEPQKGQLSLF